MNIICAKWGTKYSPEYVNKLFAMVSRNSCGQDFDFYCYTDDTTGLSPKIRTVKIESDLEGFWPKLDVLKIFNKGENIFFDLDVVILKNINCFATWGDENTFAIINDFSGKDVLNSSIMKWNNINASSLIWETYFKDRPKWRKVQGDQNVITDLINKQSILKVFPDEWTFSYKWYSRVNPRFHKSEWTFEQDLNAKVAVFHGKPDPHESEQKWVKDNWK